MWLDDVRGPVPARCPARSTRICRNICPDGQSGWHGTRPYTGRFQPHSTQIFCRTNQVDGCDPAGELKCLGRCTGVRKFLTPADSESAPCGLLGRSEGLPGLHGGLVYRKAGDVGAGPVPARCPHKGHMHLPLSPTTFALRAIGLARGLPLHWQISTGQHGICRTFVHDLYRMYATN